MKKALFSIFTVVVVAASLAFTANTQKTTTDETLNYFAGSFEEALKASAEQQKPIFIDGFAAWCHWCKHLDKTTLRDANVVSYLNKNFITIRTDMEEGEGKKLAQKYQVSSYPTLLFVNSAGKVIDKVNGYLNASKFQKELQKVKSDFN